MTPGEKWQKAQGIRRYVWSQKPDEQTRRRHLAIANSLERDALVGGFVPEGATRLTPDDERERVGTGDERTWPAWLRAEVARLRCGTCKAKRAWWYTEEGRRVRVLAAAREGVDEAKRKLEGALVRCRDCALALRPMNVVDVRD